MTDEEKGILSPWSGESAEHPKMMVFEENRERERGVHPAGVERPLNSLGNSRVSCRRRRRIRRTRHVPADRLGRERDHHRVADIARSDPAGSAGARIILKVLHRTAECRRTT